LDRTRDNTFGPQVVFNGLPPDTRANRPPSEGLQFFGMVLMAPVVMTVSLHNLAGEVVYTIDLEPEQVLVNILVPFDYTFQLPGFR